MTVLGSITQETTAVGRSTLTRSLFIPQAVQIIIKSEFSSSRDVTHGEQAYTCVSINGPFLSLTVGLTAVVHETREVPFGTCIYNPILVNCEHIKVCDVEIGRAHV